MLFFGELPLFWFFAWAWFALAGLVDDDFLHLDLHSVVDHYEMVLWNEIPVGLDECERLARYDDRLALQQGDGISSGLWILPAEIIAEFLLGLLGAGPRADVILARSVVAVLVESACRIIKGRRFYTYIYLFI